MSEPTQPKPASDTIAAHNHSVTAAMISFDDVRDVFVAGTRDGIDIEVLIRNGEIWTEYPNNVPRNPG